MGVEGLWQYVEDLLTETAFASAQSRVKDLSKDCPVVIDGGVIRHLVDGASPGGPLIAYHTFDRTLRSWFEKLLSHFRSVIIVLDGPFKDDKAAELGARLDGKLVKARKLEDKVTAGKALIASDGRPPCMLLAQLHSTVKGMAGVEIVHADGDADAVAVQVYMEKRAVALISSDGDYLLFAPADVGGTRLRLLRVIPGHDDDIRSSSLFANPLSRLVIDVATLQQVWLGKLGTDAPHITLTPNVLHDAAARKGNDWLRGFQSMLPAISAADAFQLVADEALRWCRENKRPNSSEFRLEVHSPGIGPIVRGWPADKRGTFIAAMNHSRRSYCTQAASGCAVATSAGAAAVAVGTASTPANAGAGTADATLEAAAASVVVGPSSAEVRCRLLLPMGLDQYILGMARTGRTKAGVGLEWAPRCAAAGAPAATGGAATASSAGLNHDEYVTAAGRFGSLSRDVVAMPLLSAIGAHVGLSTITQTLCRIGNEPRYQDVTFRCMEMPASIGGTDVAGASSAGERRCEPQQSASAFSGLHTLSPCLCACCAALQVVPPQVPWQPLRPLATLRGLPC